MTATIPDAATAPATVRPKRRPRVVPTAADAVETFGGIKLRDLATPAFRGRYLFSKGIGWLFYDGTRWIPDAEAMALNGLADVIRQYTHDITIERALNAADIKEIMGFSSSGQMNHALKLLRGVQGVDTDPALFDPLPKPGQPWLVPCANGVTIELYADGTKKVRKSSPDDMNTKTACAYDPEARAPNIAAAFRQYQPNEDVRRYQMQMWCRGLSGMGAENFIADIGPGGGNGKGTMWGCVEAVGGSYAHELPVDIIIKQPGGSARDMFRSELAKLRGCRLLYCEEPDEGAQYNQGVLKRITGGGKLDGRAMRMDEIKFEAKWLFGMAANSRPTWKADGGLTRRYIEIAWNFSIVDSVAGGQREDFKEALKAEAPGFLNAILDQWTGVKKPSIPEAIRLQTEKGNAAASPLAPFRNEMLIDRPGGKVKAGELHDAYLRWALDNRVRMPLTKTAFGRELPRLGIDKRHEETGTFYHGVGLLACD